MMAQDFRELLVDVIGKPYFNGGQGPDCFDCWGLVKYIYKECWGIKLKDFSHIDATNLKSCSNEFINGANSSDWIRVEKPQHKCIVAMSRSKIIHHVGIWLDIDGGLCLHALDGKCVIAQTLNQLSRDHFSKILFFRHGKNISNK